MGARPRVSNTVTLGNLLVHGDNLDALRALHERGVTFRCAYLDPPYNTGRAFPEYDDARTAEEWRAMMRPRLAMVRALLQEDGVAFVEIDDRELGSLLTLMDETFGSANRVSIVTVVRSAATGHKAINLGPVSVSDYVLVYAKDRRHARLRALTRPRQGYDRAYRTFLVDPSAPVDAWTFEPLAARVASAMGYASRAACARAVGKAAFEAALARFATDHAGQVVRFAQPRYEAVSREARRLIDASKKTSRVLRLERPKHADLLLYRGNRVLFLASKTAKDGGARALVEPLTNVWDDLGFQGIAREGGVKFVRNKKPEKLLWRVLEMATDPGDRVLDPFAGSGTTAAVAHKTGRRWVAIEQERPVWTAARARLERVVAGKDPTGITKAVTWKGGGTFAALSSVEVASATIDGCAAASRSSSSSSRAGVTTPRRPRQRRPR
jgi:adenine-specific DNA-methyltransferase